MSFIFFYRRAWSRYLSLIFFNSGNFDKVGRSRNASSALLQSYCSCSPLTYSGITAFSFPTSCSTAERFALGTIKFSSYNRHSWMACWPPSGVWVSCSVWIIVRGWLVTKTLLQRWLGWLHFLRGTPTNQGRQGRSWSFTCWYWR